MLDPSRPNPPFLHAGMQPAQCGAVLRGCERDREHSFRQFSPAVYLHLEPLQSILYEDRIPEEGPWPTDGGFLLGLEVGGPYIPQEVVQKVSFTAKRSPPTST